MNKKNIFGMMIVITMVLSIGVFTAKSQEEEPARVVQAALGTAFTYQGYLEDNGSPANGTYDLKFALYDAAGIDSNKIGPTVPVNDIALTNGVFTVLLDFETNAFIGEARYLGIRVREGAETGAYEDLQPRQRLTPVPAALSLPGVSTGDADYVLKLPSSDRGGIHIDSPDGVGVYITNALGHGIIGGTAAVSRYGGVFQNSAPGGAGLYANGGSKDDNDLVLGGPINDNGILSVHPDNNSGDLEFRSNDDIRFELNVDNTGYSDNDFVIRNNGNTLFSVDEEGTTTVEVLQIDGGADIAEGFNISANAKVEPEPGMVVCIDPANPGALIVCNNAYDFTVAGAVSGAGGVNPGMVMGQEGSIAAGEYPVALTGRVYVMVDASYGAIQPGDLLTTSNTPGHAMKVNGHSKAQGAILGKAMTGLDNGIGLVLVLVTLQ